MEAIILKCRPGVHFHFGEFALDSNMSLDSTSVAPHSDTLFSAIIRTVAQISTRETTDRLVDEFRNGNIQVSSVNFCLEYNGNYIYFLPKPICAGLEEEQEYKRIRKIKFVSKEILDNGYIPKQWLDSSTCTIIQDQFVIAKNEMKNLMDEDAKHQHIYSISSSPKVKVHTTEITDKLYNQSNVEIGGLNLGNEKALVHYYFLLNTKSSLNAEMDNWLSSAINLLPETGIGGERSTGCGNIASIERGNNIDFSPAENSSFLSLSLIAPQKKEENSYIYFDLITRGGRHIGYKQKHLKTIRLIKEGAVLHEKVLGKIVDITPKEGADIPYLRNGMAFLIPLHENYF